MSCMLSSCRLTVEARVSSKIKMDRLLSIWKQIELEITRFVSCLLRVKKLYNAFKVPLISTRWKAMDSIGINVDEI